MSPVSTDEIFERYLQKAITEINELGDEIAHAAGESHFPVVGSGHPLADIFLLKYGPQASEAQEGVSFYGRAGQAIIKSLQRLNVDALAVYGTNCLKFAGQKPEQARAMLVRELHIVQPKLVVLMGDDTLRFVNELDFPLSDQIEGRLGELQRFTPTIDALFVPDIDASLDEQERRPSSGTRSRRSVPGGRSCRHIEAVGASPRSSRTSRRSRRTSPCTRGFPSFRCGGTWRSSRVLVIPAVFATVGLLLPLRQGAAGAGSPRSYASGSRSGSRSWSGKEPASFAKLGAATFIGWLFLDFFEEVSWVVDRGADHPVGRRVFGLARADEHDRRAPQRRVRAALVRVPRAR